MSTKNTNSHLRVRMLCEGAMMVALAQVLSYIKLMELPNGGSLTPAMFPIILWPLLPWVWLACSRARSGASLSVPW